MYDCHKIALFSKNAKEILPCSQVVMLNNTTYRIQIHSVGTYPYGGRRCFTIVGTGVGGETTEGVGEAVNHISFLKPLEVEGRTGSHLDHLGLRRGKSVWP